jgi:hypothetical protein
MASKWPRALDISALLEAAFIYKVCFMARGLHEMSQGLDRVVEALAEGDQSLHVHSG